MLNLRRTSQGFTPNSLSGCVLYMPFDQAILTREAGMAAQFTAATSEYLSNSGTAGLRGGTTWWRAGWVYLDSAGAMTIQSCLGTNVGHLLSINATPALVLEAGSGSGTSVATHGTTLTTATWYFFFAYYDGTNVGISLNDGADTTTALASYSAGATAWNMGALVTPGTYFNGRMQCVYGGDGTLTAAQRTKIYNSGTPLAYDQLDPAVKNGLTFAFELNEPSGTREDLAGTNDLTDNNTVTTNPGTVLNAVGVALDLSGRGNTGNQSTQANKPVVRQNGITDRNCLKFDGVDDYLSVTDSSELTFPTEFTFSAWYQVPDLAVSYSIIGKGTSDVDEEYVLAITTTGLYLDVGNAVYLDRAYTISVNTWYNIMATHIRVAGSSQLKIYINMTDIGGSVTNPTQALGDNASNVSIGSRFATGGSPFKGLLGEVCVFNRLLNEAERLKLFNHGAGRFGVKVGAA